MVQCLGLCIFIAEGTGSIPGWGTKIPQAEQHSKKKKKKKKEKKRRRKKKEPSYDPAVPFHSWVYL